MEQRIAKLKPKGGARLRAAGGDDGCTMPMMEADEDGDGFIDLDEWKALMRTEVTRYKARTRACVLL